MDKILDLYNKGLELIPVAYRVPLAIIILIILVYSLINFLKKNLIWVVIFILLLPAAWPSIKQVVGLIVMLSRKFFI